MLLIYLIKGILMIIVGCLAVIIDLKWVINWNIIYWGWLIYIISYLLKLLWVYLTNEKILIYFKDKLPDNTSLVVFWSYLGILSSIFECGIVLIFLKYLSVFDYTWKNILGFGIAYGSLQAVIIGIYLLGPVIYYSFRVERLSDKKRLKWEYENKFSYNNLIVIPIPIIECLSAIIIHVFTIVLITMSVKNNNYILFWYSFIFKIFVEEIKVWMHFEKNKRIFFDSKELWSHELIFMLLAVISYFGVDFLIKFN